ncbi:MAG: hypothetical protein ACR2MB_04855 [Acidimicrobiales bacterium]
MRAQQRLVRADRRSEPRWAAGRAAGSRDDEHATTGQRPLRGTALALTVAALAGGCALGGNKGDHQVSGAVAASLDPVESGLDPDMDRVWWYGKSNPVNFGRFNDPVINQALDTGRSTTDAAKRKAAYEAINRQFAKNVWNVYLWYSPWTVAEAANVHGVLGPALPGNGGPPPVRLVTGHSLLGIWIGRG